MYIHPFVAGAFATIIAEQVILIVASVISGRKKKDEKEDEYVHVEALVNETVWVVDHHLTVTPYLVRHIDVFDEK